MNLIDRIFGPSPWKAAWVMNRDGEVFEARFRETPGGLVIKTNTDRCFLGAADGTTSIYAITKWWPEVALP